MTRVSRGVTARARHKKVIKRAKGYYGRRKNVFRVAVQAVERGMQYAYRDRKKEKVILEVYGFKESTLELDYMV